MINNKKILIIQILIAFFICNLSFSQIKDEIKSDYPVLNSVSEVIEWCEKNLRYQNDDPWDPAPELVKVFKDKYGDCKMLAGVVCELLRSVGQENKIVTIKKSSWHMFVIYKENDNWRVIENARLRIEILSDLDGIKKLFGVKDFIKMHDSYDEFKKWFNEEIYLIKK